MEQPLDSKRILIAWLHIVIGMGLLLSKVWLRDTGWDLLVSGVGIAVLMRGLLMRMWDPFKPSEAEKEVIEEVMRNEDDSLGPFDGPRPA